MQSHAIVTATAKILAASHKAQTYHETFTGEVHGKLWYFVALLCRHLINRHREFPNEQSKLRYMFSRVVGGTFEQMMHLINNDHVNLKNFQTLVTSLEQAYGEPNRETTAEWGLDILRLGNRDFVAYCTEFQSFIADLHWDDVAKRAAFHPSLGEELKHILSILDL
jgi:hypothetical protein